MNHITRTESVPDERQSTKSWRRRHKTTVTPSSRCIQTQQDPSITTIYPAVVISRVTTPPPRRFPSILIKIFTSTSDYKTVCKYLEIPNYVRQTSEFLCATACSAYMLSIARPSVRSVIHRKTVEVRILEFSPYGSPIPLVFAKQVSSRNSKGFPRAGASNKEGWAKSAVFYLCEYLENGSRYS